MKFLDTEVAKYYNVTRDHYNFLWNLDQNRSLHYGYWTETGMKNYRG